MKPRYIVLLALGLILFISGCENIAYYNEPGSVQMLGTTSNLNIFLQVKRQKSSSLQFYDAPSVYASRNTAKMVEISSDGTYLCKDINLPRDFNLNPNISYLFYFNQNIYFFAEAGFRIGEEFIVAELYDGVLRKTHIDNQKLNAIIAKERGSIIYNNIDEFSIQEGAVLVKRFRYIGDDCNVTWNSQDVRISVVPEDHNFKYIITVKPLLSTPITISIPYDETKNIDIQS